MRRNFLKLEPEFVDATFVRMIFTENYLAIQRQVESSSMAWRRRKALCQNLCEDILQYDREKHLCKIEESSWSRIC